MKLLNGLNTKHESIKFEYHISKTSILFLDTAIHIKNNKLYTKTYRKKDHQTFLNIKFEHPKSLKPSIMYSQARRIKRICLKTTDCEYHLQYFKILITTKYLSVNNSQKSKRLTEIKF